MPGKRAFPAWLCAAFALASCGSPPAQAQTWQVFDQPGGYKVARGDGSGQVQGMGLTCERNVPMIALSLARAPARNPALLSLSDGKATGRLGVVRNGATNVWACPVRDARVLAMLARAGSVEVAIDGVRYGTVSLTGAAEAMRGALGGCWAGGATVVAALPGAPAAATKPMLPIKPGYYVGTFDKQCATASSAMYYDGGNCLGDTSEPLRTIRAVTRSRDGEYDVEFVGQVDDDVAGSDGMLIKPVSADRIKVSTNDIYEMRLCAANTLPNRLLVAGIGAAPVVASPTRSQAGGIRLASGLYVPDGMKCSDVSWTQMFHNTGGEFNVEQNEEGETFSRKDYPERRITSTTSYLDGQTTFSLCPKNALAPDALLWSEKDLKSISGLPIKPGLYRTYADGKLIPEDMRCGISTEYVLFEPTRVAMVGEDNIMDRNGQPTNKFKKVMRVQSLGRRLQQIGSRLYANIYDENESTPFMGPWRIEALDRFEVFNGECDVLQFRPVDPRTVPAAWMPRF